MITALVLAAGLNFFQPDFHNPFNNVPQPQVECEDFKVHDYEVALGIFNRHMEKIRQRAFLGWEQAHNRLDRRVADIASKWSEDLTWDQQKDLHQAFSNAIQDFWAEVMPIYHKAKQELYQAHQRFQRAVCK